MGAVICDLDGVVWLAGEAIPGSVEAIADLRRHGWSVLFVTNNSWAPPAGVEAALGAVGIPAEGDVLTSAQAAARLVEPGWRVMVVGGPGLRAEVEAALAEVVDEGPVDAVVVGLDRDFGYESLSRASTAVREGARFIASNTDATYPTPTGATPGAGALVAAIATASGVEPVVAGKPHEPMAALVRERCGDETDLVVIGDRPSTDGLFARRLGARFAQVLSGVSTTAVPEADLVGADLAEVAAALV